MLKLSPPTARGQKTRAKLLEAAEHVFGKVGYEAASIAGITQRAKVALGTFYVYFAREPRCLERRGGVHARSLLTPSFVHVASPESRQGRPIPRVCFRGRQTAGCSTGGVR